MPDGALQPGRWPCRPAVFGRFLIVIALAGAGRDPRIALTHGAERIGLPDQPCELGQRVAFGPGRRTLIHPAVIAIVRGKRSVLVSFSHRDDASASGNPPTRFYRRTGP